MQGLNPVLPDAKPQLLVASPFTLVPWLLPDRSVEEEQDRGSLRSA